MGHRNQKVPFDVSVADVADVVHYLREDLRDPFAYVPPEYKEVAEVMAPRMRFRIADSDTETPLPWFQTLVHLMHTGAVVPAGVPEELLNDPSSAPYQIVNAIRRKAAEVWGEDWDEYG